MCNTKLGQFCATHENWAELLTEKPYCLKIKEDGPYVIFNYDQIHSNFNNSIVQEARGIIFKKGYWKHPVCWAFNKFGNAGESWVKDIDWDTAFVSEKVDGSLIKVWWDWNGGWHVSTNGTIDAWKAEIGDARMPNFGYYFLEALGNYYNCFGAFVEDLDFDLTYMFELVGPYNRVVVPYEEPELYFLGARNKHTGEEFNCSPLIAGALGMGKFKLPKQYPLTSVNDCVKLAETFSWDQEGFVACDAQFNRVKIKSPAYVLAHFARNNNVITRKHLIDIILKGEMNEFLIYAADYAEQMKWTKQIMDEFTEVMDTAGMLARNLRKLTRPEAAEVIKHFHKLVQPIMFANHARHVSGREYVRDWDVYKWERNIENFLKMINGGQK